MPHELTDPSRKRRLRDEVAVGLLPAATSFDQPAFTATGDQP